MRGRQLDGQRHALQVLHQGRHRIGLGQIGREVGAHRTGPVDEQGHRRVAEGAAGSAVQRRAARGGQRQRRQRALLLAVQPQRPARGDQQIQVGAGRQQVGQQRADVVDQLLDVVQHQQRQAPGQQALQLGHRRGLLGVLVQRQQQRRQHRVGGAWAPHAGHQRHKRYQVEGAWACAWQRSGGRGGQRLRRLHGQPRLAVAARPQHADQAVGLHIQQQPGHLGIGAVQARQVGRQLADHRCAGQGQARCLDLQCIGQGRQAQPLFVYPGVGVAGHQLAAVQRPRLGLPAAAHRCLEGHGIAGQGARPQAQGLALGQQQRWQRGVAGQRRSQRGQQLAQAVAAHRQARGGPELVDQGLARMGAVRGQGQLGQQGGGGTPRQVAGLAQWPGQLHIAQQAQLPPATWPGRTAGGVGIVRHGRQAGHQCAF